MGAKAKQGSAVAPDLMKIGEAARRANLDPKTVRARIERGTWPLPHSVDERVWLFRRDVVEHWLKTGEWPEGVRFRPGQGRGRGAE